VRECAPNGSSVGLGFAANDPRDRFRVAVIFRVLTTLSWVGFSACSGDGARTPTQPSRVAVTTEQVAYSVREIGGRPQFVLLVKITNGTSHIVTLVRCGSGSALSRLERRTDVGWVESHSYACTGREPSPLGPGETVHDSVVLELTDPDLRILLAAAQSPSPFRAVYWIYRDAWPPPVGTTVEAIFERSNEFTVALAR
jgi:hypothetical protein